MQSVYKAKRANKPQYRQLRENEFLEFGSNQEGKELTEEDLDTIFYSLYKSQGSKGLAEFIADRDFVEFRRTIPRQAQKQIRGEETFGIVDSESMDSYYDMFSNPELLNKIFLTREYPQIATQEQLLPYLDYMNPQSPKFNMSEVRRVLAKVINENYESQTVKKYDSTLSPDIASDTDVVRASKEFESELRRDLDERQNNGNKEWRDD